ncbi:MAG: hypothetical protein EP335_12310 [Alphaproteobacteria bacterium]|nr:MAG: hypothetical protein EP335_12310 [Alphaproteobacteria bacterium]
MTIRSLFAILLCLSTAAPALAQSFEVTESRFRFDPHENGFGPLPLKLWNPTSAPPPRDIALYFSGFIDPNSGCTTTANGNLFEENPPAINNDADYVDHMTGLGQDNAVSWSPKCPSNGRWGSSFATTSLSKKGTSGIGLYTHTGPQKDGTVAFFQPRYKSTDPKAAGATQNSAKADLPSANIQGLYANFPTATKGKMLPFSSPCTGPDCDDRIRLRAWADQSVATVANSAQSQTQQKMAMVLVNLASSSMKNGVQVQSRLEITPYTLCAGINCGSDKVNASFDGATQVYFVGGPMKSGGSATILTIENESTPVWESYGMSTLNRPFDTTRFHYEISWKNFKETLRLMTKMACKREPALGCVVPTKANPYANVEKAFGAGWDVPTNWALRVVRFGQEVANPAWDNKAKPSTAYIGGNLSLFQVDAITSRR